MSRNIEETNFLHFSITALHDFGKERKLKLSAKEKLNEIKRLKEEFKNNKHELLDCLLDG